MTAELKCPKCKGYAKLDRRRNGMMFLHCTETGCHFQGPRWMTCEMLSLPLTVKQGK